MTMTITMVILIGILVIISIRLLIKNKQINNNINYIKNKLKKIYENDMDEIVRVFAVDNETQDLLVEINHILDYNHKMKVDGKQCYQMHLMTLKHH